MKDDVSALLSSQVVNTKAANLLIGQPCSNLLESPQNSFSAFKNEILNTKNNLPMPESSSSESSSSSSNDLIDLPYLKLNSNNLMSGGTAAVSYLNNFEQQIKLLEEQAKQLKNDKNEDFFVISSMQNNNIGLSFDQFKTNEIDMGKSQFNMLQSYDCNELNNFNRACNKSSLLPIFNSNVNKNRLSDSSTSLTDIKNEEIYLKQVK
jgi:hypothetical protein